MLRDITIKEAIPFNVLHFDPNAGKADVKDAAKGRPRSGLKGKAFAASRGREERGGSS